MAVECRLCGKLEQNHEMLINIQDEQKTELGTVKFYALVEYFSRVELATDPSLSPLVCRSCKVSLELFTVFCEKIDNHQEKLKRRYSVKKNLESLQILKEAKDGNLTYAAKNSYLDLDVDKSFRVASLLKEDFDSSVDENNDASSLAFNGYAKSTIISTSNFDNCTILRKKVAPDTQRCTVVIERLAIDYVKTDTEDELESSENEGLDLNTSLNSVFKLDSSNESNQPSPSKRMRLDVQNERSAAPASFTIPVPFKKETEPPIAMKIELQNFGNESLNPSFVMNCERHRTLFSDEIDLSYNESAYNMDVPEYYKNSVDGSIYDLFRADFVTWCSLELKCNIKACSALTFSPDKILVHNKEIHLGQNNLVRCASCKFSGQTSKVYDFVSYMQHAIIDHNKMLRYSCFGCSKIFFNFTALFIHHSRCSLADLLENFSMCLFDGFVFKDFESLVSHVKDHAHAKNVGSEIFKKATKLLDPLHQMSQINNTSHFCDICTSEYQSDCSHECHNLTHSSRQALNCEICYRSFKTNFSLNRHKICHRTASATDVDSKATN